MYTVIQMHTIPYTFILSDFVHSECLLVHEYFYTNLFFYSKVCLEMLYLESWLTIVHVFPK